ncbi:hypothetical protein [Cystobacter fuscus]|uniref:hypothetical protein n=1 Tax=Cystobacter fuscus TaxID=43 RepID=UPI0012FDD7FE|nr:hypothetical protein [Cystobacter fuscus]
MSQLIPSPSGAYQAIALDDHEGASVRSTVIKVLRTGERTAHDTKAVQEVTLTCSLPPRIAWMSDNLLVIHERGAPSRPMMRGEVSFVFSPWKVEALSAEAKESKPKAPPVDSACGFPGVTFPADFAVLAGGAYAGREGTVRIDQSGRAASTMTVTVNHPGKPVALMLGAYEPTIWSIQLAPGTTLLAVLASGFHRQVVTGLDATTPVAIHTYDNKSPCGFFTMSRDNHEELNPIALRFFGREVDRVHPAYKGVVTMGGPHSTSSPWMSRGDAPVEAYIDTSPPPINPRESLDEAVRQGLLRRANSLDWKQWETEMEKLAADRGVPLDSIRGPHSRSALSQMSFRMSRAYVVLQPMTLPPRLCGALSAVFFVPKGVERPRGDPGHSSIYDFNDMSYTDAFGHE